jgi:hypothetical protein
MEEIQKTEHCPPLSSVSNLQRKTSANQKAEDKHSSMLWKWNCSPVWEGLCLKKELKVAIKGSHL